MSHFESQQDFLIRQPLKDKSKFILIALHTKHAKS